MPATIGELKEPRFQGMAQQETGGVVTGIEVPPEVGVVTTRSYSLTWVSRMVSIKQAFYSLSLI
jgi:hypothetical protein